METKKYRPWNGEDGMLFCDKWCRTCVADSAMNGTKSEDDCSNEERCEILGDTMTFNIDDPVYPGEWLVDENGPRCTSYRPLNEDNFRKLCKPAGYICIGDYQKI